MGDPVRAGRRARFAVMLAAAAVLPALARAQSRPAGPEEALTISVHPSTPTIVELPAAIKHARILHRGEFLFETVGRNVNVRPHPGTPAGTEALVEVETGTARWVFRLRVVARPENAIGAIALPGAETEEHAEEARPEVPPVVPAAPEPAARASTPAPEAPATPLPQPDHAPITKPAKPVAERSAAAAEPVPFDLYAHAVIALGITALDVAEYEPRTARQPHGALGLRLTGMPQGAWWALEANVTGEWLAGRMAFARGNSPDFKVRGPWLRAEVGVRARVGRRWMPSAYAGLGMHAHIRTTDKNFDERSGPIETMEPGAVLALGLGLQYRARAVLLGLDFQVRQGGPDNYLSVAALWTVGCLLDQGE